MQDVPKHDELMWSTLEAVKSLGGSATISEISATVIELLNIPEAVQNLSHKTDSRSKLECRLAWVRTYLKNGGLLNNSERGVWTVTAEGEQIPTRDAPAIVKAFKEKFTEKQALERERRKNSRTPPGQEDHKRDRERDQEADQDPFFSTDDDGEAEEDWKQTLLNALLTMAPDAFERLAARVLRESGFHTVRVTGRSGDGGIDGTGVLEINLITFSVAFQCKRYKGSVGAPKVRDFRGGVTGQFEKGLLITTGSFTGEAQKEAVNPGAMVIDLVDGERLCDLLKELELGVKTERVERITVDAAWFGAV